MIEMTKNNNWMMKNRDKEARSIKDRYMFNIFLKVINMIEQNQGPKRIELVYFFITTTNYKPSSISVHGFINACIKINIL